MQIKILSHPLVSPVAWIIYTAFFIFIISSILSWRSHEALLKKSEAELVKRRRSEAELRLARDLAETASRTKTEFLAHISHEIRTPINAILGYAGMLAQTLQNDSRAELVSTIDRSSRALLALINDALDLSRLEAGRIDIQYSEINLYDLREDLLALFKLRCEEKRINLDIEIDKKTPLLIEQDIVRLRQILVNLIGNAIKFTAQGFVSVRLSQEEHTVTGRPYLLIAVRDSGPGIEQKHLENIFNPFFQDPTTGALYGGTGLGLHIVEQLSRELGGNVFVKSKIGEGTTFSVELPLDEIANAALFNIEDSAPAHFLSRGGLAYSDKQKEGTAKVGSPLSFKKLIEELGESEAKRLQADLRKRLKPELKKLSASFILDEWEALIKKLENALPDIKAPSIKLWFTELKEALAQFDGARLNSLKEELARFLDGNSIA